MLNFLNKTGTQILVKDKFPHARVMVIGDIMLDSYIWGKVSRISPEAPIPVVKVDRKSITLGGSGNVAHNLVSLGCQVKLLGVVGNDVDADILMQEMSNLNINTLGLVKDPDRPTTTKTRILGGSQQLIRLDNESSTVINNDIEQSLLKLVDSQLIDVDIVVLSDYGKGVLTNHVLKVLIDSARKKGIPVLIDPKRSDYLAYTGATVITPNRIEAELAIKRSLTTDEDCEKAAREFQARYGLDAVIITRGEQGMTLVWKGNVYHFPTQAREVFDISGAGDTAVATLAAGIAAGMSWPEAVELANLGAGVVVQKVGTAPLYQQELMYALEQEGINAINSKILSLPDFSRRLAMWKAQGKKIVFTNGCFDLLHVGHVIYLEKAKATGDILIVGLNTDDSIRRLKGPERPLISEADRARILASLISVDAIAFFQEDTPIKLIEAIKPDILVKGADYREEEVVGGDFVRSYQGQVKLIPLVDDRSTSKIVDKIRRSSIESASI